MPDFCYIRMMSEDAEYHLDLEIDQLTNSILHKASGESLATELTEVSAEELKNIKKEKGGWHFSWKSEFRQLDRKVYKLTVVGKPDEIQGLVSISDMKDHFYLNLAESAPFNFGDNKIHEGVGGNLFAFCCKLSWDSGNDGIIAFKSKTRLLKHYQEKLGAVHIGNHNMIIYPEKALILINKYFKD